MAEMESQGVLAQKDVMSRRRYWRLFKDPHEEETFQSLLGMGETWVNCDVEQTHLPSRVDNVLLEK